jgi:hypothetical protein
MQVCGSTWRVMRAGGSLRRVCANPTTQRITSLSVTAHSAVLEVKACCSDFNSTGLQGEWVFGLAPVLCALRA